MKSMIYYPKIIDLAPSTVDGEDAQIVTDGNIIDGYVELRLESGIQFWAFAEEDWRVSRWSLSLIGKTIPLWFVFLNLRTELSDERIKTIVPLVPNMVACDHYTIVAQVSHPKIKTSSVGLHASKISAVSWSYSSSLNSY